MNEIIPAQRIERSILQIRGHRVLVDADLASLYGVTTKRLNEQVKRNRERFPEAFAFVLTDQEFDDLRSQFATSSSWGGRRHPPMVFTEHGALMLASVLKSRTAVQVSIRVVQAFVQLREMLAANRDLAKKLEALESKYDRQFKVVFDAIRELMEPPPERPKGRLGFHKE